jgi:peptidoglycan/LPS O-acetylase OafA/YrhL
MLGGGLLTPAFVLQPETTPFIYTAGLALFYVGSGMLLIGVLLIGPPPSRIVALSALLGTYPYSIYLWHLPVAWWGIPMIERTFGASLDFIAWKVLYLTGSVALGVFMAKLIEVPTMRLRDRWYPSRSVPPGILGRAIEGANNSDTSLPNDNDKRRVALRLSQPLSLAHSKVIDD